MKKYNRHVKRLIPSIAIIMLIFHYSCYSARTTIKMEPYKSDISEQRESYYSFMLSQFQINRGNYDEALIFIRTASKRNPESTYLRKELIYLLQQLGKYKEALEELTVLLEKEPKDIELLIKNGEINLILKNIEKAEQIFSEVNRLAPEREEIYFVLAEIYLDMGRFEDARAVYKKMILKFPNSYEGYLMLGKLYIKADMLKEAEQALSTALYLNPMSEDTRFEIIKLFKLIGANTQDREKINDLIVAFYNQILKYNSSNVRAYLELAYFYHTIGKKEESDYLFEQIGEQSYDNPKILEYILAIVEDKLYIPALVMIEEIIPTAPDKTNFHYIAGLVYEALNDSESAKRHYLQVARDHQTLYENSTLRLAIIYKNEDRIEDGIELIKNIIEDGTNKDQLFFLYLGLFYEETGELNKAEKAILKGLKKAPEDTNLIFRLGVIYDKRGKKDSCIKEMKKVISYNPNDAQALNYLGYTYAEMGEKLDEAERLIKNALRIKPNDGYIIDSLGWVLYKKGKYKEAIIQLEKALQYIKDDPVILEHLGDAYLKENRIDMAIKYYNEALKLSDKENKTLKEKLINLHPEK